MLNETLAGKIPHETSQAIHPGFYVLSKYMDLACAAACCQVHYILSIHAPEWFLLKPLSFIVGHVRLCREQLILTEVGVELPDWLSTEDNRHWVTLQGRRIQQAVGFVFLWSISFTFLDNMCFVLSLFHIINWQWLRIQFFFPFVSHVFLEIGERSDAVCFRQSQVVLYRNLGVFYCIQC